MKATNKFLLPALLSTLALLAASGPAQAVGQGQHVCHDIDVQAEGHWVVLPLNNPNDSYGLEFESEIPTGLLRGTLRSYLSWDGDGTGDTMRFTGIVILITKHGSRLTLSVSDLTFAGDDIYRLAGEFSGHGVVTDDSWQGPGTGRFEGATGELYFHGSLENYGSLMVFDEISGTICLEVP